MPHPGHRFLAGIVSRAVRLRRVSSLGLRDVEPARAERGILSSCGSIRQRCLGFGADFAHELCLTV